ARPRLHPYDERQRSAGVRLAARMAGGRSGARAAVPVDHRLALRTPEPAYARRHPRAAAEARRRAMNRRPFALLVPLVLVVLAAAVAIGSVPLGPGELLDALRSPDADAAPIVRSLRAPRVLLAFLVGGSLAVCGAALQAL